MEMRLGIKRVAGPGEAIEQFDRIPVLEQGPVISSGHTLGQRLDIGVEPHGDAAFEDQGPGPLVDERTAAGRDNLKRTIDQSGDNAALAVAEAALAMAVENLGNGTAGSLFDLVVGIDEREPEALREPTSDGRFSSPHQADQDYASIGASIGPMGENITGSVTCIIHSAGAIQGTASWGKRRAMRISPPARRRKSPLPMILLILAVLLIGFLFWLSTRDTEVPLKRIEQDVTNEALAP
jgi:hypothetical protein